VWQYLSFKRLVIAIFVLCALPEGIFLAVATPLAQVSDETSHVARELGLLHGAVVPVRKFEINPESGLPRLHSGVKVNLGILITSFGKFSNIDGRPVVTQDDYIALRNEPPNNTRIYANIPNTGLCFPVPYIPAAAGFAVSRLFSLNPFLTLMAGRFFMLAAFIMLGCIALSIAGYGEGVLLTVLLVPMTLSLAASLSQDGILIGLTSVAAAAFTRNPNLYPKLYLLGVISIALVIMDKAPYLPLLGLAWLPFSAPQFWRRFKITLIAAIPIAIWIIILALFVIAPFDREPYHPYPFYKGDHNVLFYATNPAINLHIILSPASRLITMPLQFLGFDHGLLIHELIGVLGRESLFFSEPYYLAWKISFFVALLGLFAVRLRPSGESGKSLLNACFVLLLLAVTTWAIIVSQYLNWDWVGEAEIGGPQGRYFSLLLPFLILAVPSLGPSRLRNIWSVIPVTLLGLFDLGYFPLKIMAFFYLH
jgi:hypothetical protein